jgi:hypothetical protein
LVGRRLAKWLKTTLKTSSFLQPFIVRFYPEPCSSASFRKIYCLEQLVSSRPGGLGDGALHCPEAAPPAGVSEATVKVCEKSLPRTSWRGSILTKIPSALARVEVLKPGHTIQDTSLFLVSRLLGSFPGIICILQGSL